MINYHCMHCGALRKHIFKHKNVITQYNMPIPDYSAECTECEATNYYEPIHLMNSEILTMLLEWNYNMMMNGTATMMREVREKYAK